MIETKYIFLSIAALIPVIASGLVFLIDRHSKNRLSFWARQLLIGIIFGAIAILGTEWGIDFGPSVVNCRDAPVLAAGLLFGCPAGIIAGTIGGVERFISVAWGGGQYTQIACSVSTIMAGFLAAWVRHYALKENRPNCGIALLCSMVIESFHMIMIFLTHLNDVARALDIVKVCTLPMLLSVSVSVMLSTILVNTLDRGSIKWIPRSVKSVRVTYQSKILTAFVVSFLVFSSLGYWVETIVCTTANQDFLIQNLTNVKELNLASIADSSALSDDKKSGYRKIGDTGYVILSQEKDGKIVSSPEIFQDKNMKDLGLEVSGDEDFNVAISAYKPLSNMYEATVNNEQCECMDTYKDQFRLTAVYPVTEGYIDRDRAFTLSLLMQILLFAIVFSLSNKIININVIKPIDKINNSLRDITDGDLNTLVNVRSNLEFVQLSDGINTTVTALQKYTKEAQERIEKELELARNIQKSALPKSFQVYPEREDYEIYACMNTAREVGGDFYDFYFTDPSTLNFLVADVSGKGIPAAMFMMRAKTHIKDLVESGIKIDEVIKKTNQLLCEDNQSKMFVTVWLGSLNLNTGLLTYVNAGHNSPLIIKNDGNVNFLEGKHNFILGINKKAPYMCKTLQLSAGDALYLYTDGVTEAMTENRDFFGNERLRKSLSKSNLSSMKKICESVQNDIDQFVQGASQADDITMLAIKYLGNNNKDYIIVKAKQDNLPIVKKHITDKIKSNNAPTRTVRRLSTVIDEVFHNIVCYAYPDTQGSVEVVSCIKQNNLEENNEMILHIDFIDEGIEFNPLNQDPVDINASSKARKEGGFGIFIVRKIMDKIEYRRDNNKNVLSMEMAFSSDTE